MLLVSACLLGLNTKYNGQNNYNPEVVGLYGEVCLVPACPEQLGGLPTPRPAVEISGGDGRDVLAGRARVLAASKEDRTEAFIRGARETLRLAQVVGARAALFKARSPSCGNLNVYDGSFSGRLREGAGVAAALLELSGLAVFNEEQLDELMAYLRRGQG